MAISIANLQTFIDQITQPALPNIPGVDLDFYESVWTIRCEGANQLCADFLNRHGGNDRAEARKALEPVRLALLDIYPSCAALLDPVTWPEMRKH